MYVSSGVYLRNSRLNLTLKNQSVQYFTFRDEKEKNFDHLSSYQKKKILVKFNIHS